MDRHRWQISLTIFKVKWQWNFNLLFDVYDHHKVHYIPFYLAGSPSLRWTPSFLRQCSICAWRFPRTYSIISFEIAEFFPCFGLSSINLHLRHPQTKESHVDKSVEHAGHWTSLFHETSLHYNILKIVRFCLLHYIFQYMSVCWCHWCPLIPNCQYLSTDWRSSRPLSATAT
jgi:hypothetical protein